MGKTIGIDLGTTNSCVSVLEDDEPRVLPNAEGSRTTPSIVAFNEEGERLVGDVAKRQAETNAEHTIVAVKRLMGRRFDSEETRRIRDEVSYDIVEANEGDAWVEARGETYSPEEISSLILREMREIAEEAIEDDIEDAVITVPAYFDDAQRQATQNAGRIAGLDVLRIVNEPTAAALAFGLGRDEESNAERNVAVYDLGGGTFDISILELAGGVFSVLSTAGDTFLGGEDFDHRIVEWLIDSFEATHGVDLRDDRSAMQRLKEEAERAKCELSSAEEVEISLPFIYSTDDGPLHLEETLERSTYEEMVEDLVEQTAEPCHRALEDADLTARQIDDVLLVGGMTRTPMIQRHVADLFETQPDASVNPDEVVASGAAIQGAVARGELTDVLLLDVTPLTLGVETKGGAFEPLIPRNTTIPCSHSEVFTTARDNQEMVRVHVAQGERARIEDNKSLATFELTGIPPAPRGVPEIEVTFSIDENGLVNVTAEDLGSGRKQSINVVADGGLDDAQIEQMIEDAEAHAEEDQRYEELNELRNEAEGMLFSTERSLNAYGDQLPEEEREEIREDLEAIKDLLEEAERDELEAILDSLEASAHRLADVMYEDVEDDRDRDDSEPDREESSDEIEQAETLEGSSERDASSSPA